MIGYDEAARSPVIGPMIVAAVTASRKKQLKLLKQIGVCDSKKIGNGERERLYNEIGKIVDSVYVRIIEPPLIDKYVHNGSGPSFTTLIWTQILDIQRESRARDLRMHRLVQSGIPDDFRDVLERMKHLKYKVVDYEDDDILVAAASIIATHTRNLEMRKLQELHPGIGSGEPSDARSILWIHNYIHHKWGGECATKDLPVFVRKKWKSVETARKMVCSECMSYQW